MKLRVDHRFEINCIDYVTKQHDLNCNQKYGKEYPYSLHLKAVAAQGKNFDWNWLNEGMLYPFTNENSYAILFGLYGHDLIEDARLTYNDIVDDVTKLVRSVDSDLDANYIALRAADIIYACTEEKGRNRNERHSDKFWNELFEHDIAPFVKLCDWSANIKFSSLMGSLMLSKYKQEWPHVAEMLNKTVSVIGLSNYIYYKPIIDEIEFLLNK